MLTSAGVKLLHVLADRFLLHLRTELHTLAKRIGAGGALIVLGVAAGARMQEAAKISNLAAGIVVGKLGLEVPATEEARRYLKTKKEKLGHLLKLVEATSVAPPARSRSLRHSTAESGTVPGL